MHLITSTTRVAASELDVAWLPQSWAARSVATNMRGVVYCHGNGDRAVSPMDITNKLGQYGVIAALVAAGYPVVSIDMGLAAVTPGGTDGQGNATTGARIGAAKTYIQGTLGAKAGKVFLLGISMGACAALNYAKANPTLVAGVVGIIPVCDLDDLYQNNRYALRASIGLAHGVTYPAALPAGVNPATSPGSLSQVPTYLSYSTADTVVLPATVTALASLIGATAVVHSATIDHSEASITAVDKAALTTWMAARP